jgi:hypothetical protein
LGQGRGVVSGPLDDKIATLYTFVCRRLGMFAIMLLMSVTNALYYLVLLKTYFSGMVMVMHKGHYQ